MSQSSAMFPPRLSQGGSMLVAGVGTGQRGCWGSVQCQDASSASVGCQGRGTEGQGAPTAWCQTERLLWWLSPPLHPCGVSCVLQSPAACLHRVGSASRPTRCWRGLSCWHFG